MPRTKFGAGPIVAAFGIAALAVLLNGAANPAPEPKRLPQAILPKIEPGLPADLIGRRPDLRAGELRLRSTLRRVDEKRARFYPQVSLTGNLGMSRRELTEILANPVATLGSHAVLPFLDLKEAGLQIRDSEAAYEEAVVSFRGVLLTALSAVANGLTARASLAREGEHLASAREARRRVA